MYLYLKYESKLKRVPKVTFQDCVRPQIDEVTEDRIEPALWYKVLVCDSILVDIDQRLVFWNAEMLQEGDYIHKTSTDELNVENVLAFYKQREKIFDEGDCYDFDPTVDELFDTATNIFNSLCLDVFDREGHAPTYERIMKMLHVFILPNMRFYTKHIDQVSTVLVWIERHHERVENQIRKKDTTKRNTENSLCKQREVFLAEQDFSSLKYISSLNDIFLKTLLKHLEKDFRQKNEMLIELELKIAPLRSSRSEAEMQLLEQSRSERDNVHESLQRVVIAREQIKNVISRKHVKKKFKKKKQSKLSALAGHMLYLQIANGVDEVNVEIQELINQKIKISCVREAVLQTVREIKEDGVSYGFNRKRGSFEMETDVFNISKKPEEWATLEEKVKLLLHVKQAGFRKEYEKFCERTKLRCQKLFDEAKMFCRTAVTESPLLLDLGADELKNRRSARVFTGMEQNGTGGEHIGNLALTSFTSRWSVGSISKQECERICQEIIDHLTSMSYKLAAEIHGSPDVSQYLHNKVYICYEEHVSAELMSVLNEVYEASYREQCKSLHTWISSISLSEFGFGDRKMSSLILYNPSSSSSENSRGSSLYTEETTVGRKRQSTLKRVPMLDAKSIRDMSFEELYSICNSPVNSLPQFFNGALDMDSLGDFDEADVTSKDTEHAAEGGSVASEDQSDSDSSSETSGVPDMQGSWDLADDLNGTSPKGTEASGLSSDKSFSSTLCDSTMDKKKRSLFSILKSSFRSKSHAKDVTDVNKRNGSSRDMSDSGQFSPPDPRPDEDTLDSEVARSEERVTWRQKAEVQPPYSTLPKVKDKFYHSFNKFATFIQDEDEACSLFTKLRPITLALKYIEGQLTEVRSMDEDGPQICADDLLDIVIFLLCKLDERQLLKLYAHLNLIIHLTPRFMQGNAHDYALTTFTIAYQHLFEQQVLHRPSL